MAGHIDDGSSHGKKGGSSHQRPRQKPKNIVTRSRIEGGRPVRPTAAQRRARRKRDQRLEPRR